MTTGTHVTQANRPAQFVAQIITQRFRTENHQHRFAQELHAKAKFGDAIAKLKIVSVIVDQRFKAANPRQCFFASRHRRAVRKLHAFQLIGYERAAAELDRSAEAIQLRA